MAEELRLDVDASGVVIAAVEPGSPAARAGFRPADIIVDVNGQKVANTAEMQRITSTPLRGWRIAVDRGGRLITALLPG